MISGRLLAAWFAVILWAGVIFFLSSISDPEFYLIQKKYPPDWFIHGVEYSLLGILLARALMPSVRGRGRLFAVTVTAGFLYGLTDEWHQYFVPGRTPSAGDLLIDIAAVFLGCWLVTVCRFLQLSDVSGKR